VGKKEVQFGNKAGRVSPVVAELLNNKSNNGYGEQIFLVFLSLEIPRLIIWLPHQGSVTFQMSFAGLTGIETDTTRSCRRFQREAIVHMPVWSLTTDIYWSSDERFAHQENESRH
jgi:hypothetical protein